MPRRLRRLSRSELPLDTAALARFLIGKVLVREMPDGRMSGRIVETEAYVLGDAASHAFRGETPRNRVMFLERGFAYVYFIYGNSYMLNISSEARGVGAGVLFRALQPLEGIELMQRYRGTARLQDLARGPGRLAQAMHIDRHLNGVDLCSKGPLWLAAAGDSTGKVGKSTRIGLTREVDRLLRFYERGNPFVSGAARLRV
jgi:DNA-3-methyladenine glycosylase